MPKDYSKIPINQARRKDRETDEFAVKDFLKTAPYCSIANIHNGQPFIHTNTFYFDEQDNAIYFHTAAEGRFRFNVENNNKACLSVSKMGRLLPAKEAMEFSVEYEGALVFGKVQIVEDKFTQKRALQNLLDKYFPHLKPDVDYTSTTDKELKLTAVYKMDIEQMSGKKKQEADDFDGAFYYGGLNA
ncbi:MAG: hypothetical protein D8M58_12460 [Calditrichaeota bacterium]|nr:MAG: hypothetical protein DWQ03_13245 [Calditrichota bacterium]MBL1206209.1 hypothetical protein [Calditrichota bacterium]NOG46034.1 pyridoxamine 5'-phosphate oxidase family protein [Calditrichota bacterium]